MQEIENDPLPSEEMGSETTPIESDPSLADEEMLLEKEDDIDSESVEVVDSSEIEEEIPKEESRARKTFRKVIRWTVGILIIYIVIIFSPERILIINFSLLT